MPRLTSITGDQQGASEQDMLQQIAAQPAASAVPVCSANQIASRTWRIVSEDGSSDVPDQRTCAMPPSGLEPRQHRAEDRPETKPPQAADKTPARRAADRATVPATQAASHAATSAARRNIAMPAASPALSDLLPGEVLSRDAALAREVEPAVAPRAAEKSPPPCQPLERRPRVDASLARIIDAWPQLPRSVRVALLVIAETAKGES